MISRMLHNLLAIRVIPFETATEFFLILKALTYSYDPRIWKPLVQLPLNTNKLAGYKEMIVELYLVGKTSQNCQEDGLNFISSPTPQQNKLKA